MQSSSAAPPHEQSVLRYALERPEAVYAAFEDEANWTSRSTRDKVRSTANGWAAARHERVIDEAEAMGVFGVPMFVLDGELFWGGDRNDMLIERLGKRRAGQEPTV